PFRPRTVLDQKTREFLRRIQDRLERAVDELLLAERRIVADADDVGMDLFDDWPRRSRPRNQPEIDASESAVITELGECRNVGKQWRALRAIDRQADHGAGLEVRDEILHAEERDRGRAGQHRVGGVAAAAERDAHPIGAALALEL